MPRHIETIRAKVNADLIAGAELCKCGGEDEDSALERRSHTLKCSDAHQSGE